MTSDLPRNVCKAPDRHGKMRYRFRRKGWKTAYVPGKPGSAEFHVAYAAILTKGPLVIAPARSPGAVGPRSLDDLIRRHKTTTRWHKKGERTKLVQARILERFADRCGKSGKRYGERPVAAVSVAWLDKILASMAHTPAAANVLRKVLSGLMDTAIRIGWRTDNPARLTEKFEEGDGFHTWTEAEIEQYRAKHALGTMARLTLELALNTAARLCNVATLTCDDITVNGITVDHAKGSNETTVPLFWTTRAALDALPAVPIKHLVTTVHGKPFTIDGLGNRMRKWCDDAGLLKCSMHGLRKAMSRRIAESGGTDAEGQSVTGHKKAATFVHYRAKANRKSMATRALSNLALMFDVQPEKK